MIANLQISLHALQAPFTLPTMTMAEIEVLRSKAEHYRIGTNIAIIILEAMRYATLGTNEVDSFAEDHYEELVQSIALIKVPALTIGAIVEADLSLPGVLSDMIAATGVKGFWADVCSGHKPRTRTAICVAAIVISALVVTKIFNVLNPIIKKNYPKNTDEGKRRMLRSLVLIVANFAVPLICLAADKADIFWFSERSMQVLREMSFWHGVINNLIAETAGYVIAQYIKEEGVVS
jgi:hypothetical protein